MKKSPNDVDRHVGSRIRTKRVALGISQEKLGTALGITFQQIQKYEKGTNRVGSGRLQNIGNILGVPISYFFDGMPGSDHSVTDAARNLDAVMSTPDGVRLVRAFMALGDSGLQRKVVNFIEAALELGPKAEESKRDR